VGGFSEVARDVEDFALWAGVSNFCGVGEEKVKGTY